MADTSFKKVLKGKRLVLTNKIIRIMGVSTEKERFIVIGENDNYDVVYDTRKDIWTCSCPNIRAVNCSHIIACRILTDRWYVEDTGMVEFDDEEGVVDYSKGKEE